MNAICYGCGSSHVLYRHGLFYVVSDAIIDQLTDFPDQVDQIMSSENIIRVNKIQCIKCQRTSWIPED